MAMPRCAIDVGFTADIVDDVVTVAPVLVVVRIWLLLTDITRATTLFLSKLLLCLPFKCPMARRGMLSAPAAAEDDDDDVATAAPPDDDAAPADGGDVVVVTDDAEEDIDCE